MTYFTEYDPATGSISRIVETDQVFAARDGFSFIEGAYRDDMFIVIDGVPVASEQHVETIDAWLLFRIERNQKLEACDWTQVADAPVDKAEWATYRQALRDLPQHTEDPANPVWPTPPR